MTAENPFKAANKPARPKMSAQEICDEGNARLEGRTPYSDGEYRPRPDVRWFIENGRAVIGWRR